MIYMIKPHATYSILEYGHVQLIQTCMELRMVKTYWNTNPASVTAKRPNIQVKPRRGHKIINDLRVFLKRNETQMKVLKLRFYFGDV